MLTVHTSSKMAPEGVALRDGPDVGGQKVAIQQRIIYHTLGKSAESDAAMGASTP